MIMRLRRLPALIKLFRFYGENAPFALSVGLHLFVFLLAVGDFSVWFSPKKEKIVSVPVMTVDLSNVKVSSITNLPPKLSAKKKEAPAKKSLKTSAVVRKKTAAASKSTPSDTSLHVRNEKLNDVLNDVLNKKTPQKTEKTAEKTNNVNAVNALLASIDTLRAAPREEELPDVDPDEAVNQGIEGGRGGSYLRELSVSERDALGLKLRACWNIDAGVKGAQNMIVEIRAYLTPQGGVEDVKILDRKRYQNDAAFRAVAESARRAVYICADKNEESPFLLFPQHYADAYDSWKTLLLRFNPLDGGIQ